MNKAYTIMLGASAMWMLAWGGIGAHDAALAHEADMAYVEEPFGNPEEFAWTPTTFSVYATRYHGRTAANGKRYDHRALTCASNAHKFGTVLELRYRGRTVRVTVTDRMDRKLGKSRIDLSGGAFNALNPGYDMTDRTGTLLRGEFREVKK